MHNVTKDGLLTDFKLIRELWTAISKQHKIQLALFSMLMVFGSIADALSVGAVVPFMTILLSPNVEDNQGAAFGHLIWLANQIGETNYKFFLTAFFCVSIAIAGIVRFVVLMLSVKLGHAIGHDFSTRCYSNTLNQPYSVHVSRNSSEVIAAIYTKIDVVVHDVIQPLLTLVSAVLLGAAIIGILLLFNSKVALVVIFSLGAFYLIATRLVRSRISLASKEINTGLNTTLRYLQEGLGAIRDVILEGRQKYFVTTYRAVDKRVRSEKALVQILGQTPRYIIETVGVITLALLAYRLTVESIKLTEVLPFLAMLALGAQRLIPLVQQIYLCIAAITGGAQQLNEVVRLLDTGSTPVHEENKVNMSEFKSLDLRNIVFSYGDGMIPTLKGVNLRIFRGDHVGIVGESGSGKSTVLDIMMGLIKPTSGGVFINGIELNDGNKRAWMNMLAHVSQSFFLSDASWRDNIAFACECTEFDNSRFDKSLSTTGIDELVASLCQTYDSRIGERGARLSGGQRQRIGVARALYKNAAVLILDEATSALDDNMEERLINKLQEMYGALTVIMVAHRTRSLRFCNRIVLVEEGVVREVGNYADLCKLKPTLATELNGNPAVV